MKIVRAVSNTLDNKLLENAVHSVMDEVGVPDFDDKDREFPGEICKTLSDKGTTSVCKAIGVPVTDEPLQIS